MKERLDQSQQRRVLSREGRIEIQIPSCLPCDTGMESGCLLAALVRQFAFMRRFEEDIAEMRVTVADDCGSGSRGIEYVFSPLDQLAQRFFILHTIDNPARA